MAAPFKKTVIRNIPSQGTTETEDSIYWTNFEFPTTIKEFGAVSCLNFSPVKPHLLASTSSVRVQLYDSASFSCEFTHTRFKQTAYSGRFREDGQLLVAGGDEGHVRLFRVGTKSLLRVFKKHKGAVHLCHFLHHPCQLVSFSDDEKCIVWDITQDPPSPLHTFTQHTDYVRAGDVSKINPNILVSGSYDHNIHMYDTRLGAHTMTMSHGSPVEALLLHPTGSILISAGGDSVKVWDVLAGGKLLTSMSNHHKTITSLALASNNNRLLSASLDRHVKIYDVGTYDVVHTLNYPSPLLSVAVSPNDDVVAVGAVDGLLTLSRRKRDVQKPTRMQKRDEFVYHKMLKGQQYIPSKDDLLVRHIAKERLAKHDQHLKRFNFGLALDSVLKGKVCVEQPGVTVGVMQELIRRGALKKAVGGRDETTLKPLFNFIIKHLGDPRYSSVLLDVSNLVLDLYSGDVSGNLQLYLLVKRLKDKVDDEVRLLKALTKTQGVLEMICSSALAPLPPLLDQALPHTSSITTPPPTTPPDDTMLRDE